MSTVLTRHDWRLHFEECVIALNLKCWELHVNVTLMLHVNVYCKYVSKNIMKFFIGLWIAILIAWCPDHVNDSLRIYLQCLTLASGLGCTYFESHI